MHPALLPPSKPFLKWAGGKSRLLKELLPNFPTGLRLIEPFVGAGSVFLGSTYQQYVINDSNSDLVAVWSALKQRPREFAERAAAYFSPEHHSQAAYLQIRGEFNGSLEHFERAVRLPYLNRFGFNGLYRVNRSGMLNVPYGKPSKLPTFPWHQVEAAATKLSQCLVLNGGFAQAIELAGKGDIVYCDPPYLDANDRPSFTAYTTGGFEAADHQRLVDCLQAASSRGAHVLVSNHDTSEARRLYSGWHIKSLSVRRSISATAGARSVANELLAWL